MKILFIGTGSIGKRHLTNIMALGYQNISIVSRSGKKIQGFPDLMVYKSLKQVIELDTFDSAFVCSPTANHVSEIIELVKAKVRNIYAEKPISNNWQDIESLKQLIKQYSTNIFIGYDLHFDPGLEKVKQWLSNKNIGKLLSIQATVGQYLPDWRPNENYAKGTSARIETGGGVMLDLSHEFDYVHRLMGNVQTIAAMYNHSGALDIETEDTADVLLKFTSGATGSIHLDYLQAELVRNCRIVGSNGSIFWDMALQKVILMQLDKEATVFSYKGFERNQRFIKSTQAFLAEKFDERLTTFEQGLMSLQMILAAKYSSENQVFVHLNEHQF